MSYGYPPVWCHSHYSPPPPNSALPLSALELTVCTRKIPWFFKLLFSFSITKWTVCSLWNQASPAGLSSKGCFSFHTAQSLQVRLGTLHVPHNHLQSIISFFFLQKSCHFWSTCHQALPAIILPHCSHVPLSLASLVTEDLISNLLSHSAPFLYYSLTAISLLFTSSCLLLCLQSWLPPHQCHGHYPTPVLLHPLLPHLLLSPSPPPATQYRGHTLDLVVTNNCIACEIFFQTSALIFATKLILYPPFFSSTNHWPSHQDLQPTGPTTFNCSLSVSCPQSLLFLQFNDQSLQPLLLYHPQIPDSSLLLHPSLAKPQL